MKSWTWVPVAALAVLTCAPVLPAAKAKTRFLEKLDRGLVAVHQSDGRVFLSWRLLASDADGTAFNVYRETAAPTGLPAEAGRFAARPDAPPGMLRINTEPLAAGTWFIDANARLDRQTNYSVAAVVDGVEQPRSAPFRFVAGAPALPYHSIPLQTPTGYTPNDASLGDLDGDGQYEIVLHQAGVGKDNSQPGTTDPPILQAYRLDGTLLWTINLGTNVREGAHYTQFLVYDFDGDGRAEVACKTADGTLDGTGQMLGDKSANWLTPESSGEKPGSVNGPRREGTSLSGFILKGPEYLTVFEGLTGKALDTVTYLPRRHPDTDSPTPGQMKEAWGDDHGNRIDRFLAGVAYLDGERPSIVMARGYYTRAVLAAWDFRPERGRAKGKGRSRLESRWVFDSDSSEANKAWRGQGNHNLSVADVDGDGRDEIVYGAAVIDDNGKGLYSTGWGHGDALHVGDLDPAHPGLEVFDIQERFGDQGMSLRDARTGKPLFTIPSVKADESGSDKGEGPGRGVAFNIDPRFPGAESWAAGAGMSGMYDITGRKFVDGRPAGLSTNFAVWWDGDLLRELLDQNHVDKWNWQTQSVDRLLICHDCSSNNGTKATPTLSADLWGDWREEVIWRTRDNRELRIYTSTIPTPHRLTTLMQDAQYRLAIAWQNVAYNQPPHPGFYLDEAAPLPSRPQIRYAGP
ncbi:MAG TPA: rhamnogalacturonan lyase [Steroidobacteraceae bacterium]|nr:rhamnogalacturonan lyase [Steroidobacteraceae bacterium]